MSSQNIDSNSEINFFENKTDDQKAVKAAVIGTLLEKSSNQRSNVSGETIDLQLEESLKKVNDAVKIIVGQSAAPSRNDESDTDMHICKSLVEFFVIITNDFDNFNDFNDFVIITKDVKLELDRRYDSKASHCIKVLTKHFSRLNQLAER